MSSKAKATWLSLSTIFLVATIGWAELSNSSSQEDAQFSGMVKMIHTGDTVRVRFAAINDSDKRQMLEYCKHSLDDSIAEPQVLASLKAAMSTGKAVKVFLRQGTSNCFTSVKQVESQVTEI